MIAEAFTYGDKKFVAARARISHPMADEVSIALGDQGYCTFPYTVELAFFKDGEWVTDVLPEFAEYSDGKTEGTLVYAYVPLSLLSSLLDSYPAKVYA